MQSLFLVDVKVKVEEEEEEEEEWFIYYFCLGDLWGVPKNIYK